MSCNLAFFPTGAQVLRAVLLRQERLKHLSFFRRAYQPLAQSLERVARLMRIQTQDVRKWLADRVPLPDDGKLLGQIHAWWTA